MKRIGVALLSLLLVTSLVGCGKKGLAADAVIDVYTRDSTSGTREAIFNVLKGTDASLVVSSSSVEVASNGDMVAKVASDKLAIGYASLDSTFTKDHTVLSYEGVKPTEATVLDGTYKISRPFNFVSRAAGTFSSTDVETLVAAFMDFTLNSTEGQATVKSAGGILPSDGKSTPWATLATKYSSVLTKDNSALVIKTAGSTSVQAVLTALIAAFKPLAGNVQIQPNQTGSGDGYKRVLGSEKDGANYADIGFASRAFSKDETNVSSALGSGQICLDAVVIIVNSANTLTNITAAQAKAVFNGTITKWSDIK